MRTAVLALAACSGIVLSSAFAGEPGKRGKDGLAREIDLKEYRGSRIRGDVHLPTRITNAEELAKAIPDKAWQDRIAKQVDFAKEQLLFFAWAGSGQDKLAFKDDSKGIVPAVEFRYTEGKTDDLRSHFRLYAVRKNISWQVRRSRDAEADKKVDFGNGKRSA
jgi:hypothetical protein